MITIQKTIQIKFDNEGERRRILSAFEKGSLQDQLLAVLDLFEKGDLKGANLKYRDIKPADRDCLHWHITDTLADLHKGYTLQVII